MTNPKNITTATPTIPTGRNINNAGSVHIAKNTSQGIKKHSNPIFVLLFNMLTSGFFALWCYYNMVSVP